MKTRDVLIPASRQYKSNDGSDGYIIAYDEKITEQVVADLQNTIIDLTACLRTCANSAQGGLNQVGLAAQIRGK